MKLHSRTYGESGPHVIILHGLFGMSDNWHMIAKELSHEYRVHALDLRNHGRSPHDPDMSYDAMADDIMEYMESQAVPAAALIGHSMGGKVAMTFSLKNPGMTLGLVVVDISPREYENRHDHIFEAFCTFPVDTMSSRDEATRLMTERVGNEATALFLLKNLRRNGQGGFEWKIPVPILRKEYGHISSENKSDIPYEGPTLFIRGEKGSYLIPADAPLLEKLFPSFAMHTIPGTGVHAEAPKEFLRVVEEVLNDVFS
jgi:pimeloyl-ACP methyl ester carboxylesterase